MRRLRWLVLILVVVIFWPRSQKLPRDMSPLALRLTERFGTTNVTSTPAPGHQRLEVTVSDPRWHGLNSVAVDSARVIARYAMADLMGLPRPDTIVVTMHVLQKWGGLQVGTSGIHLATADL